MTWTDITEDTETWTQQSEEVAIAGIAIAGLSVAGGDRWSAQTEDTEIWTSV